MWYRAADEPERDPVASRGRASVPQNLTMSIELVVSLISAAVALGSALLAALLGARAARGQLELQAEIERQQTASRKQEERQDLMNCIRDPVLWAAFDLQSRIFNIVAQGFLEVYLLHGSAERRAYAQRNT